MASGREDLKRLGDELRRRRLERGLSVRAVAREAGWHHSVVQRVERGDLVSPQAIVDVADAVGCRVELAVRDLTLAVA